MAKEERRTDKGKRDKSRETQGIAGNSGQDRKGLREGNCYEDGGQPKWEVSVIPSGSIALDHALGIGGYPREGLLKFSAPNRAEKPHLQYMQWQKHRNRWYCSYY